MRKITENNNELNPEINKIQEEVKQIIKNFGILVNKTRKEKNIKLQELSKRSGISIGVISDLENGKTRIPNLYTLVALARTLEIDNNKFLSVIFGDIVNNDNKNPKERLVDNLKNYGLSDEKIGRVLLNIDLISGNDKELGNVIAERYGNYI